MHWTKIQNATLLPLRIWEWPIIVASLRHTCAIIMPSNQHLDMPNLWGGMDYLGKGEVLTQEKWIFCVYRKVLRLDFCSVYVCVCMENSRKSGICIKMYTTRTEGECLFCHISLGQCRTFEIKYDTWTCITSSTSHIRTAPLSLICLIMWRS